MVFTTNDRAFYNEGIVRIDNYLKSYNKLFPVELIEELASYWIKIEIIISILTQPKTKPHNKMNTDALIVKKPYYFYEKIKDTPVRATRARFLGIHRNLVYSYLVKTRFDEVIRKNILVYSPLELYIKY